jgi:hypothetical protein
MYFRIILEAAVVRLRSNCHVVSVGICETAIIICHIEKIKAVMHLEVLLSHSHY